MRGALGFLARHRMAGMRSGGLLTRRMAGMRSGWLLTRGIAGMRSGGLLTRSMAGMRSSGLLSRNVAGMRSGGLLSRNVAGMRSGGLLTRNVAGMRSGGLLTRSVAGMRIAGLRGSMCSVRILHCYRPRCCRRMTCVSVILPGGPRRVMTRVRISGNFVAGMRVGRLTSSVGGVRARLRASCRRGVLSDAIIAAPAARA